jgi:DNA-binding SARP family transcriptional activator/tetratricopeptide (TPR) repeat protein
MPLRVGVLGPVTAWHDEREVAAGQPRQLAVLGVLAMRANRVVSRGELVDAVWGEQPPASAEGGIYTYIAGLRRVLEPDRPLRTPDRSRRAAASVLVTAGGGYLLRLPSGSLDADWFEQLLGQVRTLRARGDLAGAARAVDEALALWRGPAFAGVPGPFAEAERQRLGELRTAAVEEHADLLLARGRSAEAVAELTVLAAEYPLRERARGLLMVGLYRCGRQADALQVFRDVRDRLADELGIDPSVELTHIHQQVLATDPALDGPPEAPPPTAATAVPAGQVAAPPHEAPAPAQVPPEAAGFAGRASELVWLHAMLPPNDGAGDGAGAQGRIGDSEPAVAIVAGTAGVGKTTLAIRFARQVASHFPDGQLYVNLRGFDPSGAPADPETALRGFFEALGVPARRVPASLEQQTALFRSLLDGKRMLLLLDNARSTEQVRPLLPGSPGCMVLITSRSQLTGLVAAEGARPLPLGLLSPAEAMEFLTRRMGADRIAAEPAAATELIEQSARLPLALSVTCARAVTRPGVALVDLAAELRDARGRLDALESDDVTTDLRAVFSWSYHRLSPQAARMFRLLGLHPGTDISAAAAVSLAGTTLPAARAALAELTGASLLVEDRCGRFGCHELLRAYAAECAAADETANQREQARGRLLDHYVRTARNGSARLYPGRSQVPPPPEKPHVTPEEFKTYEAVLAWFAAENRVLRAVHAMAFESGHDDSCWTLAWYWTPILLRSGQLPAVAALQRTSLACALRLRAPVALAHVHYELGHVSERLGDFEEGHAHLAQALELFMMLGDEVNIAQARHGLSLLLNRQGRYAEALDHAKEALRLRRSFANPAMVAYSENAVGWLYAHLGQYAEALRHCGQALELHRESGSRSGAADTLDSIAYVYERLGDTGQALAHYEQALDIYRNISDPEGESRGLIMLGDVQFAAGQRSAAEHSWQQAAAVLSRIGADPAQVRDRLGKLTAAGATGAGTAVSALTAATDRSG